MEVPEGDTPLEDQRFVTNTFREEDNALDNSLRPHTLREYVGQEPVKESLNIYIQAALNRRNASR
jgi:Holliday junction DNA helicase RuvB